MSNKNLQAYDKLKDETIDICLNCTKKICRGDCKLKKNKTKKQSINKCETNKF